jgi:hypothetical protein
VEVRAAVNLERMLVAVRALPANGARVKVLAVEEQVELERFVASMNHAPRDQKLLAGHRLRAVKPFGSCCSPSAAEFKRFGSHLSLKVTKHSTTSLVSRERIGCRLPT